ncbi:hypothetical protein C8R44DRAFT_741903 [Mycena epipterygia]|nr:hypothetical protein C8R44DRAFT_741903 [Mycena epipterygia]
MFNKLLFIAIFAILALGQGAAAVPQAQIELCGGPSVQQANSAVSPAPYPLAGTQSPWNNVCVNWISRRYMIPEADKLLCVFPTIKPSASLTINPLLGPALYDSVHSLHLTTLTYSFHDPQASSVAAPAHQSLAHNQRLHAAWSFVLCRMVAVE